MRELKTKTRFFGIVVTVLALTACGGAVTNKQLKLSRTHYLLGEDLLKKKKPYGAKQELLKALEYYPANQDALNLLGVVYFFEGMHKMNLIDRHQCLRGSEADEQLAEANQDFRRAEGYFEKSLNISEEKDKIESSTLVYLANISLHFKRYDEAVGLCQRALKNDVYAARHLALGVQGWGYYLRKDYERAGRLLRQAVFHEPRFKLGRFRLAKVYYALGKISRTVKELESFALDEDCPIQEAHYLLGVAYSKQRKLDKAQRQFELCAKKNPKSCLAETCDRMLKDATRNSAQVAE